MERMPWNCASLDISRLANAFFDFFLCFTMPVDDHDDEVRASGSDGSTRENEYDNSSSSYERDEKA